MRFFEKIAKDENFVGNLYELDYTIAKVFVNDYHKILVKGLPHGCFLMAILKDKEKQREGILLRVIGSAQIPQTQAIIESITDSYIKKENMNALDLDFYTRSFYQSSGLSCRILGTFFFDKNNTLTFGTDVENFLAVHNYNVYKPQKNELEVIVNENFMSKSEAKEKIGVLRYASTQSYDKHKSYAPDIFLKTYDVIARRTAFFGMTRMGKSNTIKTIITAIEKLNQKTDKKIGQIIFDINGEYTFSNQQDEGSIYDKFKDKIIRFTSSISKAKCDENIRSIQYNFYSDETLKETFDLLCKVLLQDRDSDYIVKFTNVKFFEDFKKDSNEYITQERKKVLYKCILYKANFACGNNFKLKFADFDEEVPKEWSINEAISHFEHEANKYKNIDNDFVALYTMFETQNYRSTYAVLMKFKDLHSPLVSDSDYKKDIDCSLREGKIVLMDLSTVSTEIQQIYIDKLCSYIFEKSMEKFTNNEDLEYIQMYFEEAHNIFPKDDKDLQNIYSRLAKEGAKLRIGISYSTQEIKSITPTVLKNTENWFVFHLNNKDEIYTLEKYYDFSDFSHNIIRNNDVGFARIKTLSNNFIIPVQIEKFKV